MLHRGVVALLISLLLAGTQPLPARAPPKPTSVYPLGGQRGTTVELEFRGTGLAETCAVWLGTGSRMESTNSPSASPAKGTHAGSDGLDARVQAIPDSSRVLVRLGMAPDARVGFHKLSLISPGGLSGAVPFWVGPEAVIQETGVPHTTPETAQPVNLPVAINGRLAASGQLGYYGFEVAHEQTLAFEVVASHGTGFDPQVALYEAGGSFLDPHRSRRLVFHEEVSEGGMPANRRMTYHFTKAGRYLVSLGNVFAQGGGDFSYLLRIAPADPADGAEDAWTWARGRLREIRSRAVEVAAADIALVKEAEPNDDPARATAFAVPAVLEGTVGHPGDVDYFRFRAKAGQKLVFEVQTPGVAPPHFNPRLDVLNARRAVVLTNLHVQDGKIGTVDAKTIRVDPEVAGKLDEDGVYMLQVRDLTSVQGSPEHLYRVLVRPQIPHVGDIRLQPDGPVNLVPGARQRLTVSAPGKEGYAGSLALSVEGLPQGVKAFVGANGSTIELVADTKAPVSPIPHVLRVLGLPVAGAKSGSAFPVPQVAVMVVSR